MLQTMVDSSPILPVIIKRTRRASEPGVIMNTGSRGLLFNTAPLTSVYPWHEVLDSMEVAVLWADYLPEPKAALATAECVTLIREHCVDRRRV